MRKNKGETRFLYVVFDNQNNIYVYKYLPKVEYLTGILKTTLSKHFSNNQKPYQKGGYIVYKCYNVDLKGHYKLNFR